MKPHLAIIQTPPFWLKTPPLALCFLKTYLKSKNIEVKTFDLNRILFSQLNIPKKRWLSLNKSFEEELFFLCKRKLPSFLKKFLKDIEDITFLGFSVQKRNLPFSLSLIKEIKNVYPHKKIILGGPEMLFMKEADNPRVDYKVTGEGEKPLYEIITSGRRKTYKFYEIKNLDELPFLDFPWLEQAIPIITSRGCPYKCNFCTERSLYLNFRYHSPEYIVEEIKYLKRKYCRNTFVFQDSLLNYHNGWLEKFSSLLIKENLNIKWEAQMRIRPLPLDLARLIKKSGCYNIFIGLESGSDRVLSAMNKGFTVEEALNFFKTLKRVELHFEISLILGYPGEEKEDYRQTENFIKNNKSIIPKIAQVNPFCDYRGELEEKYPSSCGIERTKKFASFLKKEKIPFTSHFIENLCYPN